MKNKTERLIYLNRATSEAVWEWDITSGEVFRNQQLEKLTGFAQEETGDYSWWYNRIEEKDRERVKKSVAAAFDNKQSSWEEEYRYQCADGIYKMVRDRGFILYENGKPARMIGTLQDLSEIIDLRNQLIQEKLEHQKEMTKSIINAQENERIHLGNELHDNVNQILVTAGLYLDMMKTANSHEAENKKRIKELIAMAYEEIKKLSRELVASQLMDNSITFGIQDLVNDIEATGKFSTQFSHDEISKNISNGLLINLYRITQEQLKNIIQYSNAQRISVELRSVNNKIVLGIADDGIGFDPQMIKRGMGLSNIFERAKLYNGTVELDTAPGKGCRITVEIPL